MEMKLVLSWGAGEGVVGKKPRKGSVKRKGKKPKKGGPGTWEPRAHGQSKSYHNKKKGKEHCETGKTSKKETGRGRLPIINHYTHGFPTCPEKGYQDNINGDR